MILQNKFKIPFFSIEANKLINSQHFESFVERKTVRIRNSAKLLDIFSLKQVCIKMLIKEGKKDN